MKHSLGACLPQEYPLEPQRYIAAQVEMILHGVCAAPARRPQ
jgi:TetR/AcrR family transcriptional regulator